MHASTSTSASSVTSCYARAQATAVCFARLGVSSVRRFSLTEGAVLSVRLWTMMRSNNAFESGAQRSQAQEVTRET